MGCGYRMYGSGIRGLGLEFEVWGLRFEGLGFEVWRFGVGGMELGARGLGCLRFEVGGLELGARGLGFRVFVCSCGATNMLRPAAALTKGLRVKADINPPTLNVLHPELISLDPTSPPS